MDISVDLPAPFSPSRASTSPRAKVRLMASLATSLPKRLVMPDRRRTGSVGESIYFQAARNARSTLAELAAAKPMKVPISFSPSPPPARSLSERKAM